MIKVVIVNGMPESGKTTFEIHCREAIKNLPMGYVEDGCWIYSEIISTVDFVKKIALECGWDGTKSLKNRKFLSDLKDLLTEWADVPSKKIIDKVNSTLFSTVFFIDCREPKEIQKLKDALNAMTVLVRRPEVENNKTSNHADANVFDYNYDYVIWNDGNIEQLQNKADEFVNTILNDNDHIYKAKENHN